MFKNILWDFDGVILNSMPIRDYGFRKIFESFDEELVDRLIQYHNENGGLSRFHKIRYFYTEILNEDITEKEIAMYARQFTDIMKDQLTDSKYLIHNSITFIKSHYKDYNFHIVSGSEELELNYLCQKHDLSKYFLSINGSPTPKNELVKNILKEQSYNPDETILIGDSINDYEAAKNNQIEFYGFNNPKMVNRGKSYIHSFENFR